MITPNEFKYLKYTDTEDNAIEKRIDKAIKGSSSMPIRIATSLFSQLEGDLDHVLHSYTLLGWNVRIVYDWRDGDFVEMSLP